MEVVRVLRSGSIYSTKVIKKNKSSIRKTKSKNKKNTTKKSTANKTVEDLLEENKMYKFPITVNVGLGMKSTETVVRSKLKNDPNLNQVEEVVRHVKSVINSLVEEKSKKFMKIKWKYVLIKINTLTNFITFSIQK